MVFSHNVAGRCALEVSSLTCCVVVVGIFFKFHWVLERNLGKFLNGVRARGFEATLGWIRVSVAWKNISIWLVLDFAIDWDLLRRRWDRCSRVKNLSRLDWPCLKIFATVKTDSILQQAKDRPSRIRTGRKLIYRRKSVSNTLRSAQTLIQHVLWGFEQRFVYVEPSRLL